MELAKVCMLYCNFKNINRITDTLNILKNKKYYIYNNIIYIYNINTFLYYFLNLHIIYHL